MTIYPGALAPRFVGATTSSPRYTSAAFGGRYVILAFLPMDPVRREAALGQMAAHRTLFDDQSVSAFGVLRDEASIAKARDQRGLRWFLDRDAAISTLFEAVVAPDVDQPRWVLIDPFECVQAWTPIENGARFFELVRGLPAPADHAGVPLTAPVLVAPRILDPDLCRRLIAYYEQDGGQPSGVMREVDGKTIPMLDDYKRRRDADITDSALISEVRRAIHRRLKPQIVKAFQFQVTHQERDIVACYDAAEGGYFMPHRDDTTAGTAHRKFACSINLNAEDFEGGDLRFPEFGARAYRPPTGGAVVFSCSLLHEAMPVTKGRRYAYLPFFYDNAGAEVRAANAAETSQS